MALYNVGQTSAGYNEDYELYLKSTEGGTTSPPPGSYACDSIEVEAIPYPGYSFAYWLVNGVQDLSGPVISGTLQSNIEIEAVFTRNQYMLTVITNGQGSVNIGNATYPYGDQINLQATAAEGWTFSGWSGDAQGTTNTTITMNSSKTVTATFTQIITYCLKIISSTCGATSPAPGTYTCTQGQNIQITAIPDTGFTFLCWMVNGEYAGDNPTLTLSMNSNYDVEPFFTLATCQLIVITNGQGEVNPGNSSWLYGMTAHVYATPADGWIFAGWGGDFTEVRQVFSNTFESYTYMDGPKVVVVNFEKEKCTLTTNIVGQGTVTPGNTTYTSGQTATLTAQPADGWVFSGWSGDATGTTNTTITMNTDKTVTATFTKANTYPVQIVSGNITQAQCTDMTVTTVPSRYSPEIYSDLVFNFTITGPSGTSGYCKIAVPVDLVCNVMGEHFVYEVYFYVDNVRYDLLDFSFDDTNYYLTFYVHFSTHDICIEFRETEPTPTPSPTETPSPTTTPTTNPTPTTTPRPTATPTVTPTATPTSTPAPTTSPTTQPTATTQPTSTSDLTLPIAGIVALLAVVIAGLVVKSRKHKW
jgi:uncharacterized repeat protein (TIGR02543 family)